MRWGSGAAGGFGSFLPRPNRMGVSCIIWGDAVDSIQTLTELGVLVSTYGVWLFKLVLFTLISISIFY
jgi:hypothetical protein